eukprot:15438236-Alexandrium_andersonii.AAC.1
MPLVSSLGRPISDEHACGQGPSLACSSRPCGTPPPAIRVQKHTSRWLLNAGTKACNGRVVETGSCRLAALWLTLSSTFPQSSKS